MTLSFDPTITASVALSALVAVFAWFRTRGDKVEARFKAGSDRMDRHETRIVAIEQTLRSMPDNKSIHRLELMMAEVSGDLKAIRATMAGDAEVTKRLEAIVSRHEQHLLETR